MKRYFIISAFVLCSFTSWSQTMNIHYKNGQTVEFNMDNIELIEFIETQQNNTQVSSEKAVDLGLSVKWASCNVGATSPEQFGNKYAWGETETKEEFTKENYIYYNEETMVYTFLGDDISGTEFDVIRKNWGGQWRMPTWDELCELRTKCKWEWANYNKVNGFKVTGPNGNTIFLPVNKKSYYWTSTMYRNDNGTHKNAWILDLDSGWTTNRANASTARHSGLYIRPVMPK